MGANRCEIVPRSWFKVLGTEQDTHRLLGVLHFSDTQVLQGDDPTGLFVLGQVQGERLYSSRRRHLFFLPRPILNPPSQA